MHGAIAEGGDEGITKGKCPFFGYPHPNLLPEGEGIQNVLCQRHRQKGHSTLLKKRASQPIRLESATTPLPP
jgi:hypothetical protein